VVVQPGYRFEYCNPTVAKHGLVLQGCGRSDRVVVEVRQHKRMVARVGIVAYHVEVKCKGTAGHGLSQQ